METENDELKVVNIDDGNKNGQKKCPKCGATDISLNVNSGKLRCNFCRHEFEIEKVENLGTDIEHLEGKVIGSGAQKIDKDAQNIITLKCSSCGAEVVIDTNEVTGARCHWCRNTLSINEQIPNGAVPDVVLPFKLKKEDARKSIEAFVSKRKFYANPLFKKEFTTENIMGVYLPYMIVDMNAHAKFSGEAEKQTRKYTVRNGNTQETRYDANVYNVEREFDIAIEGLTVESSQDKLEENKNKTNNIINAIMPFDTENSAKWDANFLKGYSSEKRDLDITKLETWVQLQCQDIARYKINEDLKDYDRGVSWTYEQFNVKGEQWKSAYLPVWLYSYQEKKKNENKNLLHYVAVNARTQETMGSVPVHMPKLIFVSTLVELLGIFTGYTIDYNVNDKLSWIFGCSFLVGIAYFIMIYSKYRNISARHNHESETKSKIRNILRVDNYVKERKNLSSSRIEGENGHKVNSYSNLKNLI